MYVNYYCELYIWITLYADWNYIMCNFIEFMFMELYICKMYC